MDIGFHIICSICVSQYTPKVGHEGEMFIFFPWEPQKNEKRWQQDNVHYQKEQQNIAFVSVALDSIWILFVTEIMWLIYIVPLLWNSKHFMGILINPKTLLWVRYLAAFVPTLWSGRLQFKGHYLCSYLPSVQKTVNGVNWEGLFTLFVKML